MDQWALAGKSIPQYTKPPVPRLSGLAHPIVSQTSGLKRRCDEFQILSRGLTLAGSGQNLLHETSVVRPTVGIKQCGFIGLNTLAANEPQGFDSGCGL